MQRIIILISMVCTALIMPRVADAFCGFYVAGSDAKLFNNATQVVLMRDGTRTVLSMQNNYQGPPEDFAMVVPVPTVLQEEDVKTLQSSIFSRVDSLSSPRLVEYWEQDPCQRRYRNYGMARGVKRKSAMSLRARESSRRDYGVTIEAKFAVGEYDIVILSAQYSLGLYDWLKDNGYKIPDGAESVLRPYVSGGMKFFVAKVNIEKVKYDKKGQTKLSPLRFHYDTETFSLPVRLGLLNSRGTQDLIVYILAKNQRYEVANYKNIFIPTNIHVRNRTKSRFAQFYTSLFDQTMRKNPGAVVTEYAWQATSCDPCPGPAAALTPQELAILGADVISGGSSAQVGRGRWAPSGFVLTRLHTRYSKRSLGEDLVFKAAPPVVGGREVRPRGRRLEKGAQSSSFNNFQARYIIRHRWRGKATCKNPQWGIWGGPPSSVIARQGNRGSTAVVRDLGLVRRRKVNLSRYVLQSVPEIGLRWKTRKKAAK